jgi:hypothetical protein
MPHTAKKTKVSRKTKAVNRLRKSKLRKREKEEFAKLVYLQSQLDEYGNPLDLMNTDEELLNNEQKFVTRLIRKFQEIDKTSLAHLLNNIYDENSIDKLVKHYYANKENRSWSDTLFEITYKCLGILNLNHLLTYKISEYLDYALDNDSEPQGKVLTKDVLINILRESAFGLDQTKKLSLSEIVNTCLLIYAQKSDVCTIDDDEMYGGNDIYQIFSAIAIIIGMLSVGLGIYLVAGLSVQDFVEHLIEGILEGLFS